MTDDHDAPTRRRALECLTWGGGILWTMSAGIPKIGSFGGVATAHAQAAQGFHFAQISDSHIGFDRPANPDPKATLQEAIAKIRAMPDKPAFLLHTGDITHLSKPSEFDDAQKLISASGLETHYVPGEHDVIDEGLGAAYLARYGVNTRGSGWYSFDHMGVHFIGLVNVLNLQAGGMGNLGEEQIAWLADDLKGKSASTPIVLFAHVPLWTVYAEWGWGTEDGARALALVKRFGSVTVLNGHIHQIFQKVEGQVSFHTARSTAFPQGEPGKAPSAGPINVGQDKLRSVLGVASITVHQGTQALMIADQALA
jgi:Icc protein